MADETTSETTTETTPPVEKPEVGEDPEVETKTHQRTLERDLTDIERLKIGDEMAAAMETAAQLEAKKKAIDDELKEDINAEWSRAATLATALRKGRRETLVECQTIRDYRAGTVQVFRLDTGEEIEPIRAMTVEERQRGLYGEAAGRSSEPSTVINPGSYAEEEDDPQPQQNLGISEPPPNPAEAVAETAREEAHHA